VYLATRGVGRVREINLTVNAVRVVFANDGGTLSFKPDEAERMLEPLAAGHLLLDILDRPDEVRRLAAADGPELLRRLFASIGRQLALNELRDMLAGIVPAAQWSSWWTGVRKDRRLMVSTANACSWNDSADDADSAILAQFREAPVREKLEMARKYAKRSDALAEAMAAELERCAEGESATNPAFALELFLSLEKISASGAAPFKKAIAEFISHADAALFIREIGDRTLRKKALALIRENRTDWPALYSRIITNESDSQSLTLLYEALRKHDGAMADELVRQAFASPAKSPDFFIWLSREMLERGELKPLANWRFLQLVMQLLSSNALKEHNAALRKLFDDDGAFHQAARRIEPDQVKLLISILERDSSLEDYRREKMLKDLRAWYPQTQEVREKVFYVSAESIKTRQAEFHRLTTVDIPHNTEEIIKARAHGDLRENFEYHAARARQEMLSSRAKTLHDELQFARPIDMAKVDPSAVCTGTVVRMRPANGGEEQRVTVMGPCDSDPAKNILSYQAPVAAALLGKKVGDQVTFNEMPFVVAEIRPAAL
jgi:transcription elongation GreA/GreB family factor